MGLLKVAVNSAKSTLSDQYKEFFYCDSIPDNVLMVKARKVQSKGGANNGDDNVISNGSVIAVNEGQCMLIVDNGNVVDVCSESGEFVYDNSTEPSVFCENLGDSVVAGIKAAVRRFSFGGSAARIQRVYYINTKENMGNMYGTATPIPFHIVDRNTGFNYETNVKCNGLFSFKIVDPVLFFRNVCGNTSGNYTKEELVKALKGELVQAMQPTMAEIGGQGVLPSQLVGHTRQITEIAKRELSVQWTQMRGIEMVTMTINPSFPPEDVKEINKWNSTAMLKNAEMLNARKAEAFSNMMENSTGGKGGSSTDSAMNMMAMNMMNNMMGGNSFGTAAQATQPAPTTAPRAAIGWKCACGHDGNTGRFCSECGTPKPAEAGWTCSCGHVNQGKFCQECGAKRPSGAPIYRCDKCGFEPEDPAHPPKFCPECGDPFDENDRVQ